jgi:hypothetical protein
MILQKLLVYCLSIAVIAFIYVYKIPIFCSECEKPRGLSRYLFYCVVDEEKLCSVSHELNDVKQYGINFAIWLKDIVVNEIPKTVLNEIQKFYELIQPIKKALNDMIDKITKIFEIIKKEFVDKVTKVFSDLATNVSNMFVNIKDGTVNMANLIYQSIDNIRHNAIIKINAAITAIEQEIRTHIIDPINKLVAKIGDVFTEINNFFSGLVDKILTPFREIINGIKDTFGWMGDYVKKGFDDLYNKIKDELTKAFSPILDPLTKPFKAVAQAITDFKTTIDNGIQSVKDFINTKITEVQTYITNAFEPIKTFFKNLGDKIYTMYEETKTFITTKLTELKDKIIKFFTDSLDQLYNEIYKLFKPVIELVQKVLESFINVYKNFVASLNNLYILVKQKWNEVYKFIYNRIFYVAYIYYISVADTIVEYAFPFAMFIPMSRTLKINIFNGILVSALLGALLYFYGVYTFAAWRILGAILTAIGDLYSLVEMAAGSIEEHVIPQIYTILSLVPTLTFAMDNLSYLSPTKIIPLIISYIFSIVEFIVGFFQDIIALFPTTIFFIYALIVIICIIIGQYFASNGISRFNIYIERLKSVYEYIFKKVDTTEIKKLQTEVIDKSKKEPVIEPVKPAMDGVMGEFKTKMDNFKKRVNLIEEIRKSYEAKPEDKDNPKVLEMNIDNMIAKINSEISSRGL